MTPARARLPVARKLCRHFAGGALADCARAGLAALKADHRARVIAETIAACSVDLDGCHHAAPLAEGENRWDYVIVLHGGDKAIAVEPHPAAADQVEEMIRKKAWAASLLEREAPALQVQAWIWLTGAVNEPYFSPTHPAARRLADAGIRFPAVRLKLDP